MLAPTLRDRLRAQLADLKMPGALEALDDILRRADSGELAAGEAMSALLGSHIALRNQRRLQTAMRSARLPAVKTLADFDFTFQPSVKRDQLESLHTLSFLERRENVVFLGPPGGDHVRVHPYFRILPRAPLPGDPSPARRLGAAAREACGRNSPKR